MGVFAPHLFERFPGHTGPPRPPKSRISDWSKNHIVKTQVCHQTIRSIRSPRRRVQRPVLNHRFRGATARTHTHKRRAKIAHSERTCVTSNEQRPTLHCRVRMQQPSCSRSVGCLGCPVVGKFSRERCSSWCAPCIERFHKSSQSASSYSPTTASGELAKARRGPPASRAGSPHAARAPRQRPGV